MMMMMIVIDQVAWSVGLSVCLSVGRSVCHASEPCKRLSRSICRLGCELGVGPSKHKFNRIGGANVPSLEGTVCHLVNTTEPFVCGGAGLMSNNFDHLFYFRFTLKRRK